MNHLSEQDQPNPDHGGGGVKTSLDTLHVPHLEGLGGQTSTTRHHIIDGEKLSPDEVTHQIFVEERGSREGIPIAVLHGGPGSIFPDQALNFLNPMLFRIIIIHQRGSGESLPHGELSGNTTVHLLHDIENVRTQLEINSWHLFGWSWGTTVASLYAERHPDVTKSLTGFAVFLGSQSEHQEYLRNLAIHAPDRLNAMRRHWIGPSDESPLPYFKKFITDPNLTPEELISGANSWFEREKDSLVTTSDIQRFRINIHYAIHNYFVEPDWWDDLCLPRSLPVTFFHGKSDREVSFRSAVKLTNALPTSSLELLDCHHDINAALVQARLRKHFLLLME